MNLTPGDRGGDGATIQGFVPRDPASPIEPFSINYAEKQIA